MHRSWMYHAPRSSQIFVDGFRPEYLKWVYHGEGTTFASTSTTLYEEEEILHHEMHDLLNDAFEVENADGMEIHENALNKSYADDICRRENYSNADDSSTPQVDDDFFSLLSIPTDMSSVKPQFHKPLLISTCSRPCSRLLWVLAAESDALLYLKPLPIEVEDEGGQYKFVGENCSDFIRLISNEVGKVVPFHYTSWQNVPDQFKKAIFPTLFEYFDLQTLRNTDQWEGIRLGIHAECQRAYKDRKQEFKKYFDKVGGYGDIVKAKSKPPEHMDQEGTGGIEVFKETHFKVGKGWANEIAESDYSQTCIRLGMMVKMALTLHLTWSMNMGMHKRLHITSNEFNSESDDDHDEDDVEALGVYETQSHHPTENSYEKSRRMRIQENERKMKALGITNIAKSLKSKQESQKIQKTAVRPLLISPMYMNRVVNQVKLPQDRGSNVPQKVPLTKDNRGEKRKLVLVDEYDDEDEESFQVDHDVQDNESEEIGDMLQRNNQHEIEMRIGDLVHDDHVEDNQVSETQVHQTSDMRGGPKKVRGYTTKPQTWKMDSTQRILVRFNKFGKPVGDEANELVQFLGTLVRMPEHVSIEYPDWRKVPIQNKEDMYSLVKVCLYHF
ncbi:hypothetical protein E3N88_38836 [Mikania micrantha]|uniref:Uncharacterized protein n=1 Tax=Mikania micrantha TaxID=192012 RepID=A0A5N6LV40_9ASTR|nr:hypothetical protein E3N88_38836 [Mikania micrantha]